MKVLPAYRNIQLSSKWVKGQHFTLRYHEAPAVSGWTANHSYMALPHVLNPKIRDLYDNRDPDTLWWRIATQHLPLNKTVRSFCAKRLRTAFREVLRLKGYDAHGRPLPQEMLPKGAWPRSRPLAGTLDFLVHESAVTLEDSQTIQDLMGWQLRHVWELMEKRQLFTQPENSK